ncbi:MAG: cyclic peptide export ABC transporter [Polyangiales bacterium]
MRLVFFIANSSRGLLFGALLASVANGLLAARLVSYLNASISTPRGALLSLGLTFAAVAVLMTVLRWVALSQFVRLGQRVLAQLRVHIGRYVAEAPYEELEDKGAAALLAVLTEDVSVVGEGFMLLPWLLVHGVVLMGCVGYLAWFAWQPFLFFLAVVVLGSIGYAAGARRAHVQLARARDGEDALLAHFRALFSGAKELKLHAARREAFVDTVIGAQADAVRAARTRGLLAHARLANWRVFLFFAAIGGVLFALGPDLGVTDEVRAGYALMLLYMMLPVNALLEATPALSRMRVALDRIEALGIRPYEAATPEPTKAQGAFRELSLRGVVHSHRRDGEDGVFALGPIDLTLRAGELVYVVGGNGSGKTTLAKLLVGLVPPEAGEVAVDGRLIDDASRPAYRECFAAIFSDFHLFESLLGLSARDVDERARSLLDSLDLGHKVRIEDGSFSTTQLSSGQRKRLALLVAWLDDRPVYVFDEWAADQDPAYKEVFYREVLPALKARGKAVLVITHDDRYFQLADRCLKLESGRLVSIDDAAQAARTVRGFQLPAQAAMGEP